ncbi:unnamed protein product [Nezara viridula]|uniref:MADF domain-containing protein n=1 Tax=Nezara viridula TaxID=85310 RepID=A0A9P0H6J4_NEZVI|nr:unnamed protein product [Nezara viridula]
MWSTENTLRLIDVFHNTPCLWNVLSDDYRDREKKKRCWNIIAQQFGVPVTDVEKKIHNLKTQFYREHKRVTKDRKNRGYPQTVSNWFAYKHLMFLHHRMKLIRKIGNHYDNEVPSLRKGWVPLKLLVPGVPCPQTVGDARARQPLGARCCRLVLVASFGNRALLHQHRLFPYLSLFSPLF